MTATAATDIYSPGLEGVIAGETAISTIEGGLRYRGYPVGELVQQGTFEEVAYLLLHGALPNGRELAAFQARLAAARPIPDVLRDLLKAIPRNTHPMDAVRTAISVLSHFDPDTPNESHDATVRKAERLLGAVPTAVAYQDRFRRGLAPVPPSADGSHAANFLRMLRGADAKPEEVRALDVSLILYAEHEFNASTFTARVVMSTESDYHSAIVAAVGALKGRLHGGANEKVLGVLQPASAEKGGPEKWTLDALARKERIMGFGHRVYKTGDVRAEILKGFAKAALAAIGQGHLDDTAVAIEAVMAREKKLYPNLDWPAGRLYHALGLEGPLYTPIFVMSRITGWTAHIIEQAGQNRLIRPRSRYTGPGPRTVKPLSER